jgi:hypothetical protein
MPALAKYSLVMQLVTQTGKTIIHPLREILALEFGVIALLTEI